MKIKDMNVSRRSANLFLGIILVSMFLLVISSCKKQSGICFVNCSVCVNNTEIICSSDFASFSQYEDYIDSLEVSGFVCNVLHDTTNSHVIYFNNYPKGLQSDFAYWEKRGYRCTEY
jgi:hypothetical protein